MANVLLEVDGLRVAYGGIQAVKGVNFKVSEGELVSLIGANGAGKTTTLRAICNMVRSTGSIEFEGKKLDNKSTESIVRLGIAHVPQGRGTFTTMTVEENLQLGAISRKDGGVARTPPSSFYHAITLTRTSMMPASLRAPHLAPS
jgi:branched-chain amino acid transport system ATP-binding protein